MKKVIVLAALPLVSMLSGCAFWQSVTKHCEAEVLVGNGSELCLRCDSATAAQIYSLIKKP